MTTFTTGNTYRTRSVCNHDCIFELTVLKRTAKTITAQVKSFGLKTLRITTHDGVERVKPTGSYSMAPIITANDGATV